MTKDHFPGWHALVAIVVLVGVGHQTLMIKDSNDMVKSLQRSLLDSNDKVQSIERSLLDSNDKVESLERSLLDSHEGVHSSLQGDIRRLREDISSLASSHMSKNVNDVDIAAPPKNKKDGAPKNKKKDGAHADETTPPFHSSGGGGVGGGGRELLQEAAGYDTTSISQTQVKTPVLCAASVETWALSINGTNLVKYLNLEFNDVRRMLSLVVGSLTKVPTSVPTPLPTVSPVSCKALHAMGKTTSGIYKISVGGVTRDVYCDQTTDGGGWMLTYAYNHAAGENNPVVTAIPTNPDTGYSHVDLNYISGYAQSDIADVRFYCTTSNHARVVHFKTSNSVVKGMAFNANQASNTPESWNSGYTLLAGHSANLPATANNGYHEASGGLWDFSFYTSSLHHWSIYYNGGSYFTCDDEALANSYQYATKHLIYVRMEA
jgi:hypothetical protein